MWGTEDLNYVACGALRIRTMLHVGPWGFRLCGMWGTWCGRSLFSHSQTLLSLRPLFFGGCPELFDGLGATDASKSGSSWSSRSCLPYNSTPTSSSLVSSASLMTMFLCPAGNQVLPKSLSPDVPEKFETIRMSSRFFYFSTLNVL